MISGAITLAGLGVAGPLIGIKRPGEGAFSAPPKSMTLLPSYAAITHDSARLSAHAEPLNSFIKSNGKGYHREVDPLPFEFSSLSKKELTKRYVSSDIQIDPEFATLSSLEARLTVPPTAV